MLPVDDVNQLMNSFEPKQALKSDAGHCFENLTTYNRQRHSIVRYVNYLPLWCVSGFAAGP